jgi:phospholipid-binding lipoprotein MlaA
MQVRRTYPYVVLLVLLVAPLSGWAGTAGGASAHTPGDPWERVNRRVYAFNQRLDRALIRPLSRFTSGLTPGPIGKAIHNFLVNLNEPVVIVNDLLQARPGPAVRSAFRLFINTTVGGLGAVDVAKALGDPMHVNGFGDTLGRWGVHSGPYLVLPVFGPSSVRDVFGMIVDDATLPVQSVSYPYRTEVDVTLAVVGGLNQREDVALDLDALLDGAADPYATLRSSYLQAREAQIRGEKALPPLPDIDESPPAPDEKPPAAPPAPAGAAGDGATTPATPSDPPPPPAPPTWE